MCAAFIQSQTKLQSCADAELDFHLTDANKKHQFTHILGKFQLRAFTLRCVSVFFFCDLVGPCRLCPAKQQASTTATIHPAFQRAAAIVLRSRNSIASRRAKLYL